MNLHSYFAHVIKYLPYSSKIQFDWRGGTGGWAERRGRREIIKGGEGDKVRRKK